jgi:2,3-bisphosphoglycerate-dependent phosphoglycerate mutase
MSDLQCAARLLIARHGEAETEPSGDGSGLSLAGRKQAAELAESLRDARVSLIYCGARARSVQTAEIVAARLGVAVRVRDRLQESGGDRAAGEL